MTANVEEVQILNSEINTRYYMYVRKDRLGAFYSFLLTNRSNTPVPNMPGLSGAGIAGLDAIFERRPKKFPVHDILVWLCARLGSPVNPPVTVYEIENALERFAKIYPPDIGADEC